MHKLTSNAVNDTYSLGRAMGLQAMVWYRQHRLEEARSEALHAADIFEKFGAATDMECCRKLLQWIEGEMNNPVALYFDGELLEATLLPTLTNPLFSRAMEGIGWHRLACLSRRTLFIGRFLRGSVVRCGFGSLRSDVWFLVAGFSPLVPLILPSQYTLSRSTKLLYPCILLFLVCPHR